MRRYEGNEFHKCGLCSYYVSQDGRGQCRRNPPNLVLVPASSLVPGKTALTTAAFFPPVSYDDWCGEFEADLTEYVLGRNN